MSAEIAEGVPRAHEPFHVWFAGADGLGSSMTGLRESLGKHAYVTTSILPTSINSLKTAFPLRKGERTRGQHFKKTAQQIGERIEKEDHVVFELHSGGLWEFLDVAPHLSTRIWQGKRVDVVLLGSPGIAEPGYIPFFQRLAKVQNGMTLSEQHSVFPVDCESYYDHAAKEYSNTYGDTQEKRIERRNRFLGYLTRLEPNEEKRKAVLQQIAGIDMQIGDTSQTQIEDLLRARAKILAPYIGKMFYGEQIPDATHMQVMQSYGELLDRREKLKLLAPAMIAVVGTLAKGLRTIHKGTASHLSHVLEEVQKNGAQVRLLALVAQFDPMISPDEINNVIQAFQHSTVPLSGATVVQNFSHASYGINAKDTKDILAQLFPD